MANQRIKSAEREDDQFLITKGFNPQGAAGLSALPSSNSIVAKGLKSHNGCGESEARSKKSAEREGGQFLITKGFNSQGAADLSALPSSNSIVAKSPESINGRGESEARNKKSAGREGGLFLITEGFDPQGAAGLSALPSSSSIIATSPESRNGRRESADPYFKPLRGPVIRIRRKL